MTDGHHDGRPEAIPASQRQPRRQLDLGEYFVMSKYLLDDIRLSYEPIKTKRLTMWQRVALWLPRSQAK